MNIQLDSLVWRNIGMNEPDFPQDTFGIEIEVEGQRIPSRNTAAMEPFWHCGEDGSLRRLNPELDRAMEYKFKRPLDIKEAEEALTILEKRLRQPDTTVYPSPRASVHVHVNYGKETIRTLLNAATLSYVLEEVLVDLNGKDRIGNNFCLRAKDAEGVMINMISSIKTFGNIWSGSGQEYRYAATNLASLYRFQTIEYRSLEFTIDTNRILLWTKVLQKIKETAREFRDPREIVEKFSALGPRRFLAHVLGDLSIRYLSSVPNVETKLYDGLMLVQEFAHCNNWVNSAKTPKPVKSKTTQWADMYGAGGAAPQPVDNLAMEVPMAPPQPRWGGNPVAEVPVRQIPPAPEGVVETYEELYRRITGRAIAEAAAPIPPRVADAIERGLRRDPVEAVRGLRRDPDQDF